MAAPPRAPFEKVSLVSEGLDAGGMRALRVGLEERARAGLRLGGSAALRERFDRQRLALLAEDAAGDSALEIREERKRARGVAAAERIACFGEAPALFEEACLAIGRR